MSRVLPIPARNYAWVVIGVTFVLGATGSVLLLASNVHGSEHLRDLLVGQILWVNYAQLIPVALLSAVIAWLTQERKGIFARPSS